eukprot:2410875-Rhodomonas_salina.2
MQYRKEGAKESPPRNESACRGVSKFRMLLRSTCRVPGYTVGITTRETFLDSKSKTERTKEIWSERGRRERHQLSFKYGWHLSK